MQNHRNITTPQKANNCFKPPYRKFLSVYSAPTGCLEHTADANHINLWRGNMANHILAATPLLHNDIRALAQLFEQAFQYHRQYRNQSHERAFKTFVHNMRTLVGLSFTATLVEGDLLELFNPYLQIFQRNQAFLRSDARHARLASAIANMVCLGSDFFRCLDHPHYYKDFLQALRNCLKYMFEEIRIIPSANMKNIISLIFG